jgi:hypothetical protein
MEIDWVAVVFRWLHIAAAIVAVGGAVHSWGVVGPALADLDPDHAQRFRTASAARWKRVAHVCIAILLISGAFNIYREIAVLGKPSLYHALLLPKLLAALSIFFISSALVGRSPAFAGMRERPRTWLGVIVVLAAVVVIISGVLGAIPDHPPATTPLGVESS